MDYILSVMDMLTDAELSRTFNITHYDLRKLRVANGLLTSHELSPELRAELFAMYHNCDLEDFDKAAEELCSTYMTISSAARLIRPPTAEPVSNNEEILVDLANGLTQVEVALKHGVSQSTVSKLNPNPGKRKRYKRLSTDKWKQLLSQHPQFNISELARMYGVSRAAIHARLKHD